MNMQFKAVSLVALTFLVGCGGGSGGTPPSPVEPTNRAPVITSDSQFFVFENDTGTFSFTATDPDGDSVSLTLSGDDVSFFSLSDSQLSLNQVFDYESPLDANGDNVYSLILTASDGQAQSNQSITINVKDAFEV